jgi:hypothetical protein
MSRKVLLIVTRGGWRNERTETCENGDQRDIEETTIGKRLRRMPGILPVCL